MSHLHNISHGAAKTIESMPALDTVKNPFVAGFLGFMLGPIGIGFYLASWKDFFVCLAFLIGLTILVPGIGAIPGWIFSACYGAFRVHTSNKAHGC